MSVSALFGTRIATLPPSVAIHGGAGKWAPPSSGGGVAVIECSSRPQKKATAHHMKTRPRKTQAWDIRRRPTVYPPLPPLPSDWTLVSPAEAEAAAAPPTSPKAE